MTEIERMIDSADLHHVTFIELLIILWRSRRALAALVRAFDNYARNGSEETRRELWEKRAALPDEWREE